MKAYRCHSENGGENWIMQWSSAELIFSSQLFPNFCTCLTKYNHTHSQPWITQLWMELNAPFFCFPPLAWRREHETPQLKTHQKQWPQVCMVHEDIERYRKEAKPVWKKLFLVCCFEFLEFEFLPSEVQSGFYASDSRSIW